MDVGLSEHPTVEECSEHLLLVIACAVSGKKPRDVAPWIAARVNAFWSAVNG